MLVRPSASATSTPGATRHHRRGHSAARASRATRAMAMASSSRADGAGDARPSSSSSSSPSLLAIGATGPTGRCAINGLLAAGVPAAGILALTRSELGAGARALAERGVALAAADLDAEEGVARVLERFPSLRAVYVHALSADAASADPRELERARRLAAELPSCGGGLDLVLYNSSAGRDAESGVSQMEQKHACEDALRQGCREAGVPFLALQPVMFYEEIWKHYTRPSVLFKGKFPFSVPPDVPVHLVAARDLGTAAAAALADPQKYAAIGNLPLAGDALSPKQLCEAFSRVAREAAATAATAAGPAAGGADTPAIATTVTQSRPPAWLFWILNRDLYRIVRFLSTPPGYGVDVAAARAAVPGLMTFDAFLRATGWADPSRSYEQGIRYEGDDDGEAAAGREGSPVPVGSAVGTASSAPAAE